MYLKFDEDLYKTITNLTMTDYELYGEFLPYDSIVPMIEDLLGEIHKLQEEYEDLQNDLESNYKPLSRSDYTGDSYDDRY